MIQKKRMLLRALTRARELIKNDGIWRKGANAGKHRTSVILSIDKCSKYGWTAKRAYHMMMVATRTSTLNQLLLWSNDPARSKTEVLLAFSKAIKMVKSMEYYEWHHYFTGEVQAVFPTMNDDVFIAVVDQKSNHIRKRLMIDRKNAGYAISGMNTKTKLTFKTPPGKESLSQAVIATAHETV